MALEVEKVRKVPISVTRAGETRVEVLRLLIPNTIVNAINVVPNRDNNQYTTLYISPPIEDIRKQMKENPEKVEFELIYKLTYKNLMTKDELLELNKTEGE